MTPEYSGARTQGGEGEGGWNPPQSIMSSSRERGVQAGGCVCKCVCV